MIKIRNKDLGVDLKFIRIMDLLNKKNIKKLVTVSSDLLKAQMPSS